MKSTILGAALFSATSAYGATLEFDGLKDVYNATYDAYEANVGSGPLPNIITYDEDGYIVKATAQYPELAFAYTPGSLNLYTLTYGNSNPFTTATITKANGTAFSLVEFDALIINAVRVAYAYELNNYYGVESFPFPLEDIFKISAVKADGTQVSSTLDVGAQALTNRTVTNAEFGGLFTDLASLTFSMPEWFDKIDLVTEAHCQLEYLSKLSRFSELDPKTCSTDGRVSGPNGAQYYWSPFFDDISEGGSTFVDIQSLTLTDSDAVIVAPVPLPASGILMLGGIGLLALRRRKK